MQRLSLHHQMAFSMLSVLPALVSLWRNSNKHGETAWQDESHHTAHSLGGVMMKFAILGASGTV